MHTTKYGRFTKEFMNQRGMLATRGDLHGVAPEFTFGHNDSVGAAYAVVSEAGLCRTPTPANATTLRVKAGGNVNDTDGGSGAHTVLLIGIGADGTNISEEVTLAGVSASASTTQLFMRLYRAVVTESGTYAASMLGSGHAASIVIENTAGTEDWLRITFNGFADSQSQTACYSVGKGRTAFLSSLNLFVDTLKAVDFLLIVRNDFMNVSEIAPIRVVSEASGVEGHVLVEFPEPPSFPEFTDLAVIAKVANGTAVVSALLSMVISTP